MSNETKTDLTHRPSHDIYKEALQPGGSSEETVRLYTELAERNDYEPNYDEEYGGLSVVANTLAELVTQNRESTRILDVGAGTGYLSCKEMSNETKTDLTHRPSHDIYKEALRPGGSSEETVGLYTEPAERNDYEPNYDEEYGGLSVVANTLAELVTQNRESTRILDVGAGTGYLSCKLRAHGFRNIDGLDPTAKMLERAKEANLYTNYICEFMTEKPQDIVHETYDHVVTSGTLVGGHMPVVALREMIRLLKRGGYCCFNIREEYLTTVEEYRNLEAFIDKLEKEGKWTKIERRSYPNHHSGKTGVLYCYKKL